MSQTDGRITEYVHTKAERLSGQGSLIFVLGVLDLVASGQVKW